jgi:hypothetical protein
MDRTTMPPTAASPAAARPGLRRCSTCSKPTRGPKRGRCGACYSYWNKYGRERPPHLWGRCFTGRLEESA